MHLLGQLLRASPAGIDAAIQDALEKLVLFSRLDRGYVFRLRDAPRSECIENTHFCSAEDPDTARALIEALSPGLRAFWQEKGLQSEAMLVDDVAQLAEGSPLRVCLQAQGVRSVYLLPLRSSGEISGFAGFDTRHHLRGLARSEVDLLEAVADAIGAALARADATRDLATARAQMAQAHDRLKTTLGALSEIVVEVDASGRYEAVYTADPDQMMVPTEQLIGRTHEQVLPAEIAALNRRAMAEAVEKGHSGPHPFWAQTQRGRRRYTMTVAVRPPDRPDVEPGFVFVARDTTEDWRLAAEAERLGLIARRMTDLVMIIGPDDLIEWVNPAFETRTGWSLEEVRGRKPSEILHTDITDQTEVARIKAEMMAGRPVRSELASRTRSGDVFWTDIDLQPLRDSDGVLTGYVSIETDITERRAQAEALKRLADEATEARARLEMAVEALSDAFVYFDAEDRMVLCNGRYHQMFPQAKGAIKPGVTYETMLRQVTYSGEIPEATGREEEWIAERLAQHRDATGVLDRQMAGKWIRSIDRKTPDGGRVAMRIDITELKEAERRLADIIEGAEVGTWEWNLPLGTNEINARWAEMVGYALEELLPITIDVWRGLLHPGDLASAEAQLTRVFEGGISHFEYEFRMRHKMGHWVWVLSRGRVVRQLRDGSPEVMAGVHIDITALKRAEARLEEIINAAEAGTWELDLVTGDKRVNARWFAMLGYTREELSDRPHYGFRDLIHPDDMDMLMRQHAQIVAGQDSFANEIRLKHKDGQWVWLLSRGRVTGRDNDGRPLRIAGIHLDITDRMDLQAQLSAERDYLASIMDTTVSGIAALDAQGRIIFTNRGAERILGLEGRAAEGVPYDDLCWGISALDGGDFRSEDLPFARAISENRIVHDVRFSVIRRDGTRRMLSVNAAPIKTEGLAVRVVCSIEDITEQVGTENELRDAVLRAEAANKTKSLFLANMSHEIRTPLNGVLGMAQILEDELSDPQHLDMLATIRGSGETLFRVLNDVLDMSKIEAGKLTLEEVIFTPADLVRQVESAHRPAAATKGLALNVSLDAPAQSPRHGDPSRLAQILQNLVSNAIKFTEKGSVDVDLRSDGGDTLQLVVRDTGIGMTAEQAVRVFEDFEQADGTVTRRFGGTGLGMSIVKRLVDLMGGDIAVDSTPGVGTTVRVRLDLRLAVEAPTHRRPPEGRSIAGLRILAADDNLTNRTILKSLMSRLGVDLTITEDGQAAVDAWQPDRFDLYLLDISMPRLDGIGALAELRRCERATGQTMRPAIAITANVMAHQVADYQRAGFQEHVGKPFRQDDLVAAIANVLALD
ncbi:MAG: PAS domain S-box protein [Roseinatronobacter sp.]